jgi:hypothetical protein
MGATEFDDLTFGQRVKGSENLIVGLAALVDNVTDTIGILEQRKHFLCQRMDVTRQLASIDSQCHGRSERRQAGSQSIPLLELSEPFGENASRSRSNLDRPLDSSLLEMKLAAAPIEYPEQSLLGGNKSRGRRHNLAIDEHHKSVGRGPIVELGRER